MDSNANEDDDMIGAAKLMFKNNVFGPVTPKGTLFAWGEGGEGAIGNGTANNYSSPVQVGSEIDWTAIACGRDNRYAAGLRGGKLFTWGKNDFGQLALGDRTNRSSPVQVGSDIDWTKIACGTDCLGGIKSGKLFVWGVNTYGKLGVGQSSDYYYVSSPVQVGADTDWTDISFGMAGNAVGIRGGKMFAWGYSPYYSTGTTSNKSSPVQVGADTDWVSVGANIFGWIGIHSNGMPSYIGYEPNGQYGTGTNGMFDVINNFVGSNWLSVACGSACSFIIASNGTAYACGANSYGLGNGFTSKNVWTQIGAETDWGFIAASYLNEMGIRAGKLFTWGDNALGGLGDGTRTDRNSPVQIGAEIDWLTGAQGANNGYGIRT